MSASPWYTKRTIDAATTARSRVQLPSDWQPPAVRASVAVSPHELTCTACGETYGAMTGESGTRPFCWRCGGRDGVPTVAYLRDGEYSEERP